MLKNIFRTYHSDKNTWKGTLFKCNMTILNKFRPLNLHTDGNAILVNHEPGASLFFTDIPGKGRAFLEYERENQLIKILHTEVPPNLAGLGLGKILAKEALDYIAKNDLKAEIYCDFVRDFVTKYDPKFIKYIRN